MTETPTGKPNWLRLLDTGNETKVATERDRLIRESKELVRILSAIINKT